MLLGLLASLALAADFDTLNHSILINRLQAIFGVHGFVLNWIKSFISDRAQRALSDVDQLCSSLWRVPQ